MPSITAATLTVGPSTLPRSRRWPTWLPRPGWKTIGGCEILEPRVPITTLERFEFYARAREAYAVFATGERAFYGNLIIRKGVIPPPT